MFLLHPLRAILHSWGAGKDRALKNVSGDLSMRDVNSVAIDTVHADFSLRGAKEAYPSVKRILTYLSAMWMAVYR